MCVDLQEAFGYILWNFTVSDWNLVVSDLVTTMFLLDWLNYVFPSHWNLVTGALRALAVICRRFDHHAQHKNIGNFDCELSRELRALGVLRGPRMRFMHWSLSVNDFSIPANSNGQMR